MDDKAKLGYLIQFDTEIRMLAIFTTWIGQSNRGNSMHSPELDRH
jgi:hypothetical protein